MQQYLLWCAMQAIWYGVTIFGECLISFAFTCFFYFLIAHSCVIYSLSFICVLLYLSVVYMQAVLWTL